jgi:tetratricopeptide (TPR) repeat protein
VKRAASEASAPAWRANAQSALGAALSRAGKSEEAVAALKAAGASLAGDAWHSLWMARALMQNGDFDEAVVFFRKAAELANMDASGSLLLKRIAKDAKKGLKDAEKAKRKRAIKSSLERKEVEVRNAKKETVRTETEPDYELKKAVDSSELEEVKEQKEDQARANKKPIIEVEASPEPVNTKEEPEEVEAR